MKESSISFSNRIQYLSQLPSALLQKWLGATGEETNVTHWDRNNMATILQTTFQIDFPEVKFVSFYSNFTEIYS